jgi:mxaJ protein
MSRPLAVRRARRGLSPALAAALLFAFAAPARAGPPVLRICADPSEPPFSRARGDGFENRIARVLARDLGVELELVHVPLRGGFVRRTLGARRCDALMGVPAGSEQTLNTRPYYRSTYVFVTRAGGPAVASLDDPALRRLRVGVERAGDDGARPSPEPALAQRGIVDNVVGFSPYGDERDEEAGGGALAAVRDGRVDVAVVWGPRAGAFARGAALVVTPVTPRDGPPPLDHAVAIGVRRDDAALRDALDAALARRRAEIERILEAAAVPRLPLAREPQARKAPR